MLEENYPWWCPNCDYEAIPKSSKMWNMVQRLHKKKCKKTGRTKPNEVDGEICRRQNIIQNGPGFKTVDPHTVNDLSKKYDKMGDYLEERDLEEVGAGYVVRKVEKEQLPSYLEDSSNHYEKCECDDWIWKCEKCLDKINDNDSE